MQTSWYNQKKHWLYQVWAASYYRDLTATRSPTNDGRSWKFEYMIFLNSALFDIKLIMGIPHVCASLRKGFQDKRDYKRGKRDTHADGLKTYVPTYFIQWYKLYLASCLEIKFPFTFLRFYIETYRAENLSCSSVPVYIESLKVLYKLKLCWQRFREI